MYHLRFTPYDLSGYTFEWLERYQKYIVAREDVEDDGTPLLHYHILIDTDAHKDTVRDMVKTKLPIPAGGRGKNNKYYALIADWKDPGYICKYNNVEKTKGFTEKELLDFVVSGKKKYLEKVEKTPAENSVTAESRSTPTAKTPRIPYQQQIISIASAEWYKYKRDCKDNNYEIDSYRVVDFIMKAMREISRGCNEYLIQDLTNAILFDDLDFRQRTLDRIKSRVRI